MVYLSAVGFTDALRFELQNDGVEEVHVTEISPYYIDTPMFKGVQPGTMDVLGVDKVADVTVRAVLTNQERVYVPMAFGVLVALKNVLPVQTAFRLYKALGEAEAMVKFVGRISGGSESESTEEPAGGATGGGNGADDATEVAQPVEQSADEEKPETETPDTETPVEQTPVEERPSEQKVDKSISKAGILSGFEDPRNS